MPNPPTFWDQFGPALSAVVGITAAMFGIAKYVIGGLISGFVAEFRAEHRALSGKVDGIHDDVREMKPKVDMILQVQTQQRATDQRVDRLEAWRDSLSEGHRA